MDPATTLCPNERCPVRDQSGLELSVSMRARSSASSATSVTKPSAPAKARCSIGCAPRPRGYLRKAGHPLEGSCQEGKHPPYTPFCIFCRGMSHGISLPICRFARTRVFSDCDVTRSMATHQTPIRIKAHDGHLALWPGIRPLAHLVPQKTLGTLPCPIVTSTVPVALPEGATPKLARGRGVAKTRQVAWRPSVRG